MSISIFLDESGDLGWILDKPYGRGGSSQFMALAAVIAPNGDTTPLTRAMRGFYKQRKRSLQNELKSTDLSSSERNEFIAKLVSIKNKYPAMTFATIVVRKINVNKAFRRSPNGLYNYMTKMLLVDEMGKYDDVDFLPDARSIKVEFKHSMHDYLLTNLAERNRDTRLTTTPCESKHCLEIQFADVLASLAWSAYEYNDSRFTLIKRYIEHQELFFLKNDFPYF